MKPQSVTVIGAGLAGCECAWQLAKRAGKKTAGTKKTASGSKAAAKKPAAKKSKAAEE